MPQPVAAAVALPVVARRPRAIKPQSDNASGDAKTDITRQALDPHVRRSEKSTELATASPPSAQTGIPQAAGATSSAVAPAPVTRDGGRHRPGDLRKSARGALGLTVEIAVPAQVGKSRFDIRLDPPELRIDVQLDVDRDGKVTSRVIVDRPEMLDLQLLQHNASEIERAPRQAGLKTRRQQCAAIEPARQRHLRRLRQFRRLQSLPNNNRSPSGVARGDHSGSRSAAGRCDRKLRPRERRRDRHRHQSVSRV